MDKENTLLQLGDSPVLNHEELDHTMDELDEESTGTGGGFTINIHFRYDPWADLIPVIIQRSHYEDASSPPGTGMHPIKPPFPQRTNRHYIRCRNRI